MSADQLASGRFRTPWLHGFSENTHKQRDEKIGKSTSGPLPEKSSDSLLQTAGTGFRMLDKTPQAHTRQKRHRS